MALRGVWQLRKLTVSYCDWGGSSRGLRAFVESELPALKESNPQLEVITELNRGQHPFLKGSYKNKNERVVSVKNLSPDEILESTTRLTDSLGRKVVKLKTRHVTRQPSAQGSWTTELKLKSKKQFASSFFKVLLFGREILMRSHFLDALKEFYPSFQNSLRNSQKFVRTLTLH